RALIAPPRARMGAITPEERASVRGRSPVGGKYDVAVNRESAYEILGRRAAKAAPEAAKTAEQPERSAINDFLWGTSRRQGMVETMAKQAGRHGGRAGG